MLRLVYSDQSERLLEGLLDGLAIGDPDPFVATEIVVPNANLEAYVRYGVAQSLGVAANLRFGRLERFAARFVEEVGDGRHRLVDLEATEGALLHVLHDRDRLSAPRFARVRSYLSGPGGTEATDLRRTQLAAHLARLFEEYAYHRPEMLARWRKGELVEPDDGDEEWQSALWREILGDEGLLRSPDPDRNADEPRWILLAELLARHHRQVPSESRPLHVFGLSYVARVYQALFQLLRERRPVHLYSLNPCLEFWEDVESPRELRNRLRRERIALRVDPESLREEEDPYDLLKLDPDDTPLLRLWGSPGRESHRLLNQLSDCDYEGRFSDPGQQPETLLRALQLDTLRREPRRRDPPPDPGWAGDAESLRIVGCASVRREVEVVADEIWRRLRSSPGSPPLRFHEIAVVVNHSARDEYLPHLEAVFRETNGIPISVGDLPLPGHSRVLDAALRLLELPFGRFDRREMLKLVNHPAITRSFEDLAPEDWPQLTEELGIFFGGDSDDLEGTYLPAFTGHWDQGIRRLALGAFLTGESSGDDRIFRGGTSPCLVADPGGRAMEPRARFGLLARSLLADAETLRTKHLPLSAWATLFRRQLETYLTADEDEAALLACQRGLGRLEEMGVSERPVSGRTASALAATALARLEGRRGHHLAEGVVVSSFLPMRAIPFRAIFVLGLGEGRFPAPHRRDALDLRARRRRAGDVTPAERDRYMFLETLLSAREHLQVSWVDRDLTSGESLLPSSVIQQLLQILDEGYLEGDPGEEGILRSSPLHRHDPRLFPGLSTPDGAGDSDGRDDRASRDRFSASSEAFEEARARALGRPWRREGSGERLVHTLTRRREPEVEELRRLLRLTPVPASSRPEDETILELSLGSLRKFLESPLQAWGRVVAGLYELDEEPPEAREEEPTRIPRLQAAVLPREAFLEGLSGAEDPRRILDRKLERLELEGRIPAGLLRELSEGSLVETMERWKLLEEGLPDLSPVRVRFGRAREGEDPDRLLPSLELEIDGPEGIRGVRLQGRVEALARDSTASLMLRERSEERSDPADPRSRRSTWGLKSLFEHFVLAASGLCADRSRELLLLVAEPRRRGADSAPPALFRLPLKPVSAEEARQYLQTLATDLLSRPHDYLLPCEAVFEARRQGREGDGELLRRQVERRRSSWRRWSDRWGPVPDPETYEPPPPEQAVAMVRSRFLPLFARSGSWEALS